MLALILQKQCMEVAGSGFWAAFFIGFILPSVASLASESACPNVCGNLTIPYPFGISAGCGLPDFQLNCSTVGSSDGLKAPFLPTESGNFQIIRFGIDNSTILVNSTDLKAQSCDGPFQANGRERFVLGASSPFILASGNLFFVNGCNSSGSVSTDLSQGASQCRTNCFNDKPTYAFCNIYGCCTSNLPTGSRRITFSGGGIPYKDGGCGYSSIVFPSSYSTTDQQFLGNGIYGIQLRWAIRQKTCAKDSDSICAVGAVCDDVEEVPGIVCNCKSGYTGDGFAAGAGCKDVNECLDSSLNNCSVNSNCINISGSYECHCKEGFQGDGLRNGVGCILRTSTSIQKKNIALIGSFSTIGILAALAAFFLIVRRRHKQLARFQSEKHQSYLNNVAGLRNLKNMAGNLFMSKEGEAANLFSLQELKKATSDFVDSNKLGTGGFGTVYKGVLRNGTEVAIKKTNHLGNHGAQQFLNEVAILSQVNHRNLVRLLGCCMETQVPLLVYEYIPNGTLFDHLQDSNGKVLAWNKRLLIAIETAEALAYLHSAAFPPIYHRDVKSSNILLDETLTAKVADFGLSRLVPVNATHVSTAVQGTPGYLDPEYYQNYQLTDKSDVYSFGVVLLELITGLKPVDFDRDPKQVNLAALSLPHIRAGTINEIIDPKMEFPKTPDVEEAIKDVAQLASQCLSFQRDDRPTMKEVLEELFRIKGCTRTSRPDRVEDPWRIQEQPFLVGGFPDYMNILSINYSGPAPKSTASSEGSNGSMPILPR